MPAIGKLKLHNTGWFVARLGASWIDANTPHTVDEGTGDIDKGQTRTLDPGDVGCREGDKVWAYVLVKAGDSKEGSAQDGLTYDAGNANVGKYLIHGTTHDTHLKFEGVESSE